MGTASDFVTMTDFFPDKDIIIIMITKICKLITPIKTEIATLLQGTTSEPRSDWV